MSERDEFESYYSCRGAWPGAIERDGDGYRLAQAQTAWGVWLARAARASQPAAPVGVEPTLDDAYAEGRADDRQSLYAQACHALAMRVLQSDLYAQLDDIERAACDGFIAAQEAKS